MSNDKAARKTHVQASRRRAVRTRPRKAVLKTSVRPVATQVKRAGADAAIPVSLKNGGSSGQALIPVEVAATGKPTRRRAAVIPIAVQRRSSHRNRSRTRSAQNRRARDRSHGYSTAYPVPWRALARDVVDVLTYTEEQALNLIAETSQTAAAVPQYLLRFFLSAGADRYERRLGAFRRKTEVPRRPHQKAA